jgi:hypothetical protein
MMERSTSDLPLPAPAPAAARAAVSPSALVLAGAGTAVGLVVGLPALAALAIGASFWGVRVGVGAALAGARRRRASKPEMIDPYAVPEPWRSFVRDSLTAQTKFDQAVNRSHAGPLRDRLADVSVRVHDGVRECWRVAHLGAALDTSLHALDPEATSRDMRRLQETRGPGLPATAQAAEAVNARDATEAAMAAQLKAARRVEAASQRTTDRLRVLTAELNAAVACAVELSLDAGNIVAARQLAGDVDTVVGEIESLRVALEETNASARRSPS